MHDVLERFFAHKLAVVGLAMIILLALLVIVLPPIMGLDPYTPDILGGFNKGPSSAHWLGTDRTGRDITQAAVNELDGSGYFETRAGVVDTILLFRDFEFPYAFQGAEPSYPMIELKSVIRTAQQRADFDPALYIDCYELFIVPHEPAFHTLAIEIRERVVHVFSK